MSSLKAFLNPENPDNTFVAISNRFKENGKPIKWEIRAIQEEENKQLMKKHTKRDKKGQETFDRYEYIHELTAEAVVFPDLSDAELQAKYGLGKSRCLSVMLTVGEFGTLSAAVQELSGLDGDINEDMEEAKN